MSSIGTGGIGRDQGLVRAVGVGAMTLAILNEVVGAGIYSLPAQLATIGGEQAILAYLLCAVAMGAIVLCFAEAGSRVPTSGGPYGYVAEALGPMAGFVTGFLIWLSSVLACGGVATAVVDGALTLASPATAALLRVPLILLVLGGIVLLNIVGTRAAARAISVGTLVKLVPLLVFLVVGGLALALRGPTPVVAAHAPAEGLGRGLILVMFAFSGMETALGVSGEVKDAGRSVPRATLAAMGIVLLLYVAIQLVAQGLMGSDLAGSKAALADAIGRVDPRLAPLLLGGLVVSTLVWLGTDIFGAPRTLFAFARDGLMPAVLGRLHPRYHTPHVAILVHGGLAMLLAVTGSFVQLAILSSLAVAPVYVLACIAAWRLRRRDVTMAGPPFRVPALPIVASTGVVSMAALVASAHLAEIAALAGVLTAACAIYAVADRRRATARPRSA